MAAQGDCELAEGDVWMTWRMGMRLCVCLFRRPPDFIDNSLRMKHILSRANTKRC